MKIISASSVHDLNSIKFQNVIGFVKSFYVARGIDVVGRPIRKSTLSLVPASTAVPVLAFPSSLRRQVPKAAYNDAANVICVKYLNSKTNVLQ